MAIIRSLHGGTGEHTEFFYPFFNKEENSDKKKEAGNGPLPFGLRTRMWGGGGKKRKGRGEGESVVALVFLNPGIGRGGEGHERKSGGDGVLAASRPSDWERKLK